MKFQIGDKVKFLNEVGGGFISKIISPSLVYVSTTDGFEIPISTTELIKIETKTASDNFFDEDFGTREKLSTEDRLEMDADAKISTLLHKNSKVLNEGISLAFIPQDQVRTLFGLIDVVVINNSSFNVLFALFLKDDEKFHGQDYDSIEPYSAYFIDSIDRDDLASWLEGNVQAMFFATSMDKLISPINEYFKIKGSKLFQENSYLNIDVLEKKAFVHQLGDLKYQTLISKTEQTSKVQSAELGRDIEKALGIKKSLVEGHKIGLLEAEIDLHISALNSDYQNLEKHEIMQAQLDYFEKTLQDAMIHQYQKLIYIHGIGNGSLKNELRKVLRTYPDIQVKEAAFNRYGYGAIEVHIHYR
ncbi:MAG: DUF2027 domain-containing protein [Bacteroidales bacterium]|jgi:hypothetical protein|nr:DUF2027 domain-containing protein [Bacteroidales bacterium]